MQKMVIDSLFNDEAFWAGKEENFDETKLPWLDTSVIVDAVVVKGRAGVGVGETPTDMLSDWLDSLGMDDVNSVEDERNNSGKNWHDDGRRCWIILGQNMH